MLNGKVTELLGGLEVVFEEVQEGDVVGGHGHHDLVFLLEGLEGLDRALDLLVLDVVDGLGDLHLGLDLGQVGRLQRLDHVVVAHYHVLLDDGGH